MRPTFTRLAPLREHVGRALETRGGQRATKALRWLLLGGVLAFLLHQLAEVGWRELWAGLPRTPWFYVLSLAMYLVLPLTEALIYGRLWGVPRRTLVGPSLRKRVLNADVVGYSGDVYLFVWAKHRLGLPDRPVWQALKDNAITSSAASLSSAGLLLGLLVLSGQVAFLDLLGDWDAGWVVGGVAVAAAALGVVFRQRLFSLPMPTVAGLLGVHLARFTVVYVLQILQWWVVLPDAPFSVWATMLAVIVVANRLPLVPARDLVGIGAVLGMADVLAASEAALAGMLLARSAFDRLLNAGLFAGTSLWERRSPPLPVAPPEEMAPPIEEAA